MIEESGKIVAVQGDYAWIESERTTACGSCAVQKGCGTSAIAKMYGQRRMRLRVLNRIHAHIGDTVVVGISESGLVRGSLAVYAAPLAGLFGGALAGYFAGKQFLAGGPDLLVAGGALLGFLGALLWLRHFSRAVGHDDAYQPVVLRQHLKVGGH